MGLFSFEDFAAKVVIGLSVAATVGLIIRFHQRIWSWLSPVIRRLPLRRKPLHQAVHLIPSKARLNLDNLEQGILEGHITVANFSRKPVEAKTIALSTIEIGRTGILRPMPMNAGGRVGPHNTGSFYFMITLDPNEVRRIIEGIQGAKNSRSSPYASVRIDSAITLKWGKRTEEYLFGTVTFVTESSTYE